MGYFANGTEGAMYEERYCSRCIHYDNEIGVDPPCPIWMAHTMWAYELCNEDPQENPAKMMLDSFIPFKTVVASDGVSVCVNDQCAMFVPHDGAVIPGQLDLAGDA